MQITWTKAWLRVNRGCTGSEWANFPLLLCKASPQITSLQTFSFISLRGRELVPSPLRGPPPYPQPADPLPRTLTKGPQTYVPIFSFTQENSVLIGSKLSDLAWPHFKSKILSTPCRRRPESYSAIPHSCLMPQSSYFQS